MTRKIFITTLSTLRSARNISYYYVKNSDGTRLYCDGIGTNEAGAKYILSTQKLDKIIIVGSEETKTEQDAAFVNSLQTLGNFQSENTDHLLWKNVTGNKALLFLVHRLSQFLTGEDEEIDAAVNIEEPRKEELEHIVRDIAGKEIPEDILFDRLCDDSSLLEKIYSTIREDIESGYADREDYERYVAGLSWSALDNTISGTLSPEQFYEQLLLETHELRKNMELGVVRKEYEFFKALNTVNERIASLEKRKSQIAVQQRDVIIKKLRRLAAGLYRELTDQKIKRIDTEKAYVKDYIYRRLKESCLLHPIPENRDTAIRFVDLMNGAAENISGIVGEVYSTGEEADNIELYIDMQGGSRTDSYVMNAVFSILTNEKEGRVKNRQVIATKYEIRNFANEIVDEYNRYRITDLISGMNAFIQYGKAKQIQQYIKGKECSKRLTKLVDNMVRINQSITINDVDELEDAISELKALFRMEKKQDNDNNDTEEVFSIMEDIIERDYGNLLVFDGVKIDTAELILWCVRKQFILQALTLVESRLPDMLWETKIVYSPETGKLNELKENGWLNDYVKGIKGKNTKKIEREDTLGHFLFKIYSGILEERLIKKRVPRAEFNTQYKDSRGVKRKFNPAEKYISNISFLLNELDPDTAYCAKPEYGNELVKIMTETKDESSLEEIVQLYFVLSYERNRIVHAIEDEERPIWDLERISRSINRCIKLYKTMRQKIEEIEENDKPAVTVDLNQLRSSINAKRI